MPSALKRFSFAETPAETAKILEAAALLREHPKVGGDDRDFSRFAPTGAALPNLLLEDFSDIPFLRGVSGIDWYQLRSRTRAGDGDLFAATQKPVAGYEEYNRERLGLGAPEFLLADSTGDPLHSAQACIDDDAVMARLRAVIAERGGLRIHPYMSSRAVWRLAGALEGRVEVLGPTPPAVFAANHKGLLDRAARALFGDAAVCKTAAAADPAALAGQTAAFNGGRVALKMVDYASAMGNEVFDSARELDEARIARFAEEHHWNGEEEILLVEWRDDASQSPSSQLWVPPLGEGAPRVDGVFEQILEGDACVFQGSLPSTLPAAIQETIARRSTLLARVFQELGYRGRCSFDFILCGDEPKFVECNGRWGGTSIPMALLERVFGRDAVPFYRARDYVDPKIAGRPFPEILARLKDALYDRRTGEGHFLLYNVGCLRDAGKFDVIAVGEDRAEATRRLEEELPALL